MVRLASLPGQIKDFNQVKGEGLTEWPLSGDDLHAFSYILQKMMETAPKTQVDHMASAHFRNSLGPMINEYTCGKSFEYKMPIEHAPIYIEYIRGLDYHRLRELCKIEYFREEWREESVEWRLRGLAPFLDDKEMVKAMCAMDKLLQFRFTLLSTGTSFTSLSAGATLLVLMRIKQSMMAHDSGLVDCQEVPPTLLAKLLDSRETGKRVPLSPQEIAIVAKIYNNQKLTKEYDLESHGQKAGTTPATTSKPLPTSFAQAFLSLEMHTSLWQEQMLNTAYKSPSNDSLPIEQTLNKSILINEALGPFTFIPKKDLLKAFALNIPYMSILPCDPLLSDDHQECRKKLKGLQRMESDWDFWISNTIKALHIPDSDEMKSDRSKLLAIASCIDTLLQKTSSLARDLLAKDAEMKTIEAERGSRELAFRKRKDELRREIRDKDSRIQALETSVKRLEQLENDAARLSLVEREQDLKERERRVLAREDDVKAQEKALKEAQRKEQKKIAKESKKLNAQR